MLLDLSVQSRMLVVDDEHSILVGMKRFFQSRGFEVDCAAEREEAEALLSDGHYDCVIADLCLTRARGADGLEVVSFVRNIDPRTRVIVLTAHGSPESEEEARRLGAAAFLRKPMPLDSLASVVGELLSHDA